MFVREMAHIFVRHPLNVDVLLLNVQTLIINGLNSKLFGVHVGPWQLARFPTNSTHHLFFLSLYKGFVFLEWLTTTLLG